MSRGCFGRRWSVSICFTTRRTVGTKVSASISGDYLSFITLSFSSRERFRARGFIAPVRTYVSLVRINISSTSRGVLNLPASFYPFVFLPYGAPISPSIYIPIHVYTRSWKGKKISRWFSRVAQCTVWDYNAYTRVLHRAIDSRNIARMTRLVPFEQAEERLVRVISLFPPRPRAATWHLIIGDGSAPTVRDAAECIRF